MRGILSWSAYLPYRRLDRTQIAPFVGQGGGKGTRTVASYDEDTTTMAVEAARLALRDRDLTPTQLLFATSFPAYVDKTNATAIHAALRLAAAVPAFDLGASVRAGVGGAAARRSREAAMPRSWSPPTFAPACPGAATRPPAATRAAAFVVGDDSTGPVVAEFLGSASVTEEFVERWRAPGRSPHPGVGREVRRDHVRAARRAGVERRARVGRAHRGRRRRRRGRGAGATSGGVAVGGKLDGVARRSTTSRRWSATPAPRSRACSSLRCWSRPSPGRCSRWSCWPTAPTSSCSARPTRWRRTGPPVPSRRRSRRARRCRTASSSPGGACSRSSHRAVPNRNASRRRPRRRSEDWKFGFVGSKERDTGVIHLPPARVSRDGAHTDDMDPAPLADVQGTIVTFTVDRMVYSPSPPVVFAVVDFDGGGRVPLEITDVDADEIEIGERVEMTFRRLYASDGIVNYFWKGRLVRDG